MKDIDLLDKGFKQVAVSDKNVYFENRRKGITVWRSKDGTTWSIQNVISHIQRENISEEELNNEITIQMCIY